MIRNLLCSFLVLCIAMPALAQSRPTNSGASSTSMFGNRSLGSTVQGRSGSGGVAGAAGTGSGNLIEQAQQGAGEMSGNERFLRGNRQGAFVGADTAETTNARSQMGAQTQNFGQNMFGNLFQEINRQFGGNQGNTGGQTQLRIPIKLGFTQAPVATPKVTARLERRLANLPAISAIGPIRVEMDGQTAVLRGVVASQADKDLAEGLLYLEPEISVVQNELIVGQQDVTTEEVSPPVPQPPERQPPVPQP